MACGNERRSKVLVLDTDSDRAADIGQRLRFLNYEPVVLEAGVTEVECDSIAVVVAAMSTNDSLRQTASAIRNTHPRLPFLYLSDEVPSATGPNWPLGLPLKRAQLERLLGRAERYRG